jgi:hypothetical protein
MGEADACRIVRANLLEIQKAEEIGGQILWFSLFIYLSFEAPFSRSAIDQ